MKRSWYEIRNAGDSTVEVLLYDEIGTWGITAKDFVKDLRGIKANTINLRVNSPGGDVFDGVAIYNALKHHPAAVHTVVDGLAASSASFITQAGETVLMAEGSTMMIHEPHGLTLGDAQDHDKMRETLDKMGDTIASLYATRAGGTEAEWRDRMRAESWYRAQEAVDIHLADGLINGQGPQNRVGIFNLSKFRNVPDWVAQDPDALTDGPCGDATILDPFPNEHSCRLRQPGDFQANSFRRMSREHEGKRYDVIVGRLKGETTTTEQAYRYPKTIWTADSARSHCKDHDGSFEAASEGDETETPADELENVDFAQAVKMGVGKHMEPDLLPEYDFVSAIREGTK